MDTDQIPKGTALVVNPTALSEIKPGDGVILAIRCWVSEEGKLIPFNDNLQLLRDELNNSIGSKVFVIKKHSTANSTNNELYEAAKDVLVMNGYSVRYIITPPGSSGMPSEIIRLDVTYAPGTINESIAQINSLLPDMEAFNVGGGYSIGVIRNKLKEKQQ